MIPSRFTARAASALLLAAVVGAGFAPATADTNTYDTTFTVGSGDLVGTGSDTTQIVVKDLADAYNAGRTTGRIATYGAPSDSTNPGTISPRGAAFTRPDGSTQGKALLYGSTNNTDVDFARSSSTLSTTEIAGGLLQAPFAVDGLKMAAGRTTNATGAISLADLLSIYTGAYTNWNQLPGSTTSGTIDPYIPQAGSGTRKFFDAQLQAQNGGIAVVYGTNVKTTQENTDTVLKSDPNAILPFSTARAKSMTTIKLLGGFSAERAVYDVVRSTDLAGSRGDALKAAFGSAGFFCSAAGRKVIEADGFSQLALGLCGVWGTVAPSSLTTSDETATTTVTGLSGSVSARAVTLKAVVQTSGTAVAGDVAFYDGSAKVGTVSATSTAATSPVSLKLAGVKVGKHTYRAVFSPSVTTLNGSASPSIALTARYASSTSLTAASGRATVKVALTGASKGAYATGAVSIYSGKKKLASGTLKKGAASIKLSLKKGTYKLVAKYAGSSAAVGSSSKSVTYRVK